MALFSVRLNWFNISDDVAEATDVSAEVPTTLQCNKGRYPYWYGEREPRNTILHNKLSDFKKSYDVTGNKHCPFLFHLAYINLSNTSFATVKTCPDSEP